MKFSAVLLLVFLVALVVVEAQLPRLTLKQQKILKRRGEKCLNQYLPKTPQAAQIKAHLQTCFDPACGNNVIHEVQGAFPHLVGQLRTCIGG